MMSDVYCPGCSNAIDDGHADDCPVWRMQSLRRERVGKIAMAKAKVTPRNTTWMVSIIHPDFDEPGSNYFSERGGSTPEEALGGYLNDEDVMMTLNKLDMSLAIFCVIDSKNKAPNGREWQVCLFVLEEGTPRRFP